MVNEPEPQPETEVVNDDVQDDVAPAEENL